MNVNKVNFHHGESLDETTVKIEGQNYYLIPDAHYGLRSYFEIKHRFSELNKMSKKAFKRTKTIKPSQLSEQHHCHTKSIIPSDLCQQIIQQSFDAKAALAHPNFINSLLDLIITEELDQQLCSYFNSEYTLLWYSYLETTPDRDNRSYSSYWHCDGGPENHLKMLVYLNDYEQHLGNTKFLDKQTTDQLKKCGYIFGSVDKRTDNLAPLCRQKNIPFNEVVYNNITAGDALIFNPNQLAHIGKIPKKSNRHVLQFCFIPSPFHWKQTKNNILYTQTQCADFEGAANTLLNYMERSNSTLPAKVLIPSNDAIKTKEQLKWLLENIYPNNSFSQVMYTRLLEADPNLSYFDSLEKLVSTLKLSFRDSINWEGELAVENINNLTQLAIFEKDHKESCLRYSLENKPDPDGVFWPNPEHDSKPKSKFDLLPFVQKHPIMNTDTPIGSAGSCFAFEIARVFQEKGYNYVVTERNDNPASGLTIDGYSPGDSNAKFCANYGILFNSASFKQLAERAFNTKATKQVLFQQSNGTWIDPYRENVTFISHEAYINDYEPHLTATRNALEQAEVFIITLGLNECWQFKDGSVLSRNPRDNMYPYVKHKTLSVQENIDNIQVFFDTIKQYNPDFKLIISISPIPFLATGLGETHHVIAANTHSKSVLRVAAEELVKLNDDIYYLPSYELVNECIEKPWETDFRHVTRDTVSKVVDMFKQIFVVNE